MSEDEIAAFRDGAAVMLEAAEEAAWKVIDSYRRNVDADNPADAEQALRNAELWEMDEKIKREMREAARRIGAEYDL